MADCESRWPRVMAPSVSSRRAMVAMNLRSPFTSVVNGRNSGRGGLVRSMGAAHRPWIAWSARQPGSSR